LREEKRTGFFQKIVSMAASAIPAARMAATVFGTLSTSLTPQSAALFTRIRSAPNCWTRETMRGSSIFVAG